MALILRRTQTWDGSDLTWTETWGESGQFVLNALSPIALHGQLGVSADLTISAPFELVALAPIALSGRLGISAGVVITPAQSFVLEALAPIALHGDMGIAADFSVRVPWEVLTPLQIELHGVLGISADIVITTASTFQLTPLAPIALQGTLGISGDIDIRRGFALEALAPIALQGVLGISADIEVSRAFVLEPLAPIALHGALGIAGDVTITPAVVFELEAVAPIAMQGVLGIEADLSIGSPFALEALAPIALHGVLGIQADIQSRVPFDLVALAPIALHGSLGIQADPRFGSPFVLVAEQPIALSGELGISADIDFTIPATVPDVVGLSQAAAIAALEGAGFVVVIVTDTSDTIEAGQVISQAPPAGSDSFVGATVTITVSSGQGAATDPRLIARGRRRSKYPNISVKGLRRKKDEPETAAAPTAPSGLLLGLLARGLTASVPPAGTPEPTPALADASIPEVLLAEPVPPEPSEPGEKAEVSEVESPSAISLLEELRADVKALRAELALMRSGTPSAPDLPPLRDPIADALQAIIPALREPVDLTDPPPAAPKAPTMTKDEIDRENERRIAAAVKRLL